MLLLVGDVGGTNTRLALWSDGEVRARRAFATAALTGLEPAARAFIEGEGARPVAGCVGFAGPVRAGRARLTNASWDIDAPAVGAALGLPFTVINDFEAQALAVTRMEPEHYEQLGEGTPSPTEPIAVIGAGTGLGEALLIPTARGWRAVPGEGGHARFAPRDERDDGLLRTLRAQHPDHVSVERVVSGAGLVAIYEHLRAEAGAPRHPEMATRDPAAVVTRAGLTGADPLCAEALEMFVAAFADEAANLALKCNAGAVYLGGGIAPRILPALRRDFRRHFEAKGRYRAMLSRVPVRVVLHPDAGLLGAAVAAESLLHTAP